jgi:hypothetical protein
LGCSNKIYIFDTQNEYRFKSKIITNYNYCHFIKQLSKHKLLFILSEEGKGVIQLYDTKS